MEGGSQCLRISQRGLPLGLDHHRQIDPRVGRRDRKDIEREVVSLPQNRRRPDGRTDALTEQMVPDHNRVESLVIRIDGEHHRVLLIRAAEVDVDEPPNLQTKAVRAVRCCRDGLRRGTAGHRLEEDDAVVGVWQAARGW